MKKIINHKLYNTETAELIGEYGNDAPRSDFSHFSECLYKTKKGSYFLYGEGGPMSKYATPCGQNEVSGGEEIHPMTADEAMTWAENHLDADDFMEAFGEVEEA